MSKVYIKVVQNIIVDTDLTDVADIIDNLDFSVCSDTENALVLDHEIDSFYVTDSK